jgi:hypothetical protein
MEKTEIFELVQLPSEEIGKMASFDNKAKAIESKEIKWIEYSPKTGALLGQFYYQDLRGTVDGNRLRFRCSTRLWNRLLTPNGTPISARSLSYFFSGIQWCPGRGWPTYSDRCPLSDTSPSMLFPNAKRHQLIVQFGGYHWPECSNSNAGVGNQVTDVFVGVNDDKFDDNTGSFDFVISAYGI